MKVKFQNPDIEFELEDKEIELFRVSKQLKLPILFGCRIGACGVCCIEVVSGLENCSPKTEEEEYFTSNPNERLACQCSISGDVTLAKLKKSNKKPDLGPD